MHLPLFARWRHALALLFLMPGALLAGCSTAPPAGVSVVTPFDVNRYLGTWLEVARLDHWFERGLSRVSATYRPNDDGSVKVLNRGYQDEKGEWSDAEGRAVFTGDANTGSFKVSFFGPFYGGYHVIALDPDYRWAMVIGPDPGYLWILAREAQLPFERARTHAGPGGPGRCEHGGADLGRSLAAAELMGSGPWP